MSRSAFRPSVPATYMRELSPYQPSYDDGHVDVQDVAVLQRFGPGMPWQTTWLTLMQLAC
jgi:hypothetical protein